VIGSLPSSYRCRYSRSALLERPLIDGSAVLLGSSAAIKPVAGDVDDVDPAMFLAVRTTRSVEPMTLVTSFERRTRRFADVRAAGTRRVAHCHW